ncbi:MAG: prolipoprotein diacylglyceryl transferase [Bacteroidota bacterium]
MIFGIDWNVSSELIEGWSTPNKYGLLFVSGIIIGFFVIKRMFKSEKIQEEILDKLLLYMVVATVIGARLGHVLFYGPYFDVKNSFGEIIERGYFSHPLDILKVYEGGLASHGAALLLLIALYIFSKKISKKPMLWILDRVSPPVAIASCFIRLGNLVNHEIIGDPTSLPWGFRFNNEGAEYLINGEHVFRHPAQLYEAIFYLLTFGLLMYMYWKTSAKEKSGMIFGVFMIVLWTGRFLVEFVKVGQTARDETWALNTGQMLSIPMVIAGIVILYFSMKKSESEV